VSNLRENIGFSKIKNSSPPGLSVEQEVAARRTFTDSKTLSKRTVNSPRHEKLLTGMGGEWKGAENGGGGLDSVSIVPV
jgi:hypothetical protein